MRLESKRPLSCKIPRVLSRMVLLCVGVPVLVGVVGLAVALAISGDLPERVAVHVDTGAPRGYTERGTAIALVAVPAVAGIVAGAFLLLISRGRTAGRRLAAVAATGIAVLGTILLVGMLWEQRGLFDPRQSPGLDAVLVPAVVLAALLAAVAGVLAPAVRR
jgi:multisubunit Na+/H+ antiporter MnhF subunit